VINPFRTILDWSTLENRTINTIALHAKLRFTISEFLVNRHFHPFSWDDNFLSQVFCGLSSYERDAFSAKTHEILKNLHYKLCSSYHQLQVENFNKSDLAYALQLTTFLDMDSPLSMDIICCLYNKPWLFGYFDYLPNTIKLTYRVTSTLISSSRENPAARPLRSDILQCYIWSDSNGPAHLIGEYATYLPTFDLNSIRIRISFFFRVKSTATPATDMYDLAAIWHKSLLLDLDTLNSLNFFIFITFVHYINETLNPRDHILNDQEKFILVVKSFPPREQDLIFNIMGSSAFLTRLSPDTFGFLFPSPPSRAYIFLWALRLRDTLETNQLSAKIYAINVQSFCLFVYSLDDSVFERARKSLIDHLVSYFLSMASPDLTYFDTLSLTKDPFHIAALVLRSIDNPHMKVILSQFLCCCEYYPVSTWRLTVHVNPINRHSLLDSAVDPSMVPMFSNNQLPTTHPP